MLIIVRHTGEKTLDKLMDAISSCELPNLPLLISGNSFHDSLLNIFSNEEIIQNKNILQIDGDIIPFDRSIRKMKDLSKKAKPEIKIIQPLVLSKFAMNYRFAGVHLYLNNFVREIFKEIKNPKFPTDEYYASDRPETFLKYLVLRNDHLYKYSRFVFGIEDFNQYPEDIFRKGAMFRRKNPGMVEKHRKKWAELSENDEDFRILLQGVIYEENMSDRHLLVSNHSRRLYGSSSKMRAQSASLYPAPPLPINLKYIFRSRSFKLHGVSKPASFLQKYLESYNKITKIVFSKSQNT